ncbi:MAG: WG repeat-containing protein [Candidatus Obscuribacterales bacterium]|nr:WG repeat-containing protein [Candidatus Obscuribacterales bacterium]
MFNRCPDSAFFSGRVKNFALSSFAASMLAFLGASFAFADEAGAKWGFINQHGKLKIKAEYLEAGPFGEGLAPVKLEVKDSSGASDELFGFIDKEGSIKIQPQFKEARSFSFGLAEVRIPDSGPLVDKFGDESRGKWGFIDKKGEFAIKPGYESVTAFSDGVAAVSDPSKDGWGYIDKNGKYVFDSKFELALPFSDGIAPVLKDRAQSLIGYNSLGIWIAKNQQFSYIDKSGKEINTAQFDTHGAFADGLALVAVGEFQGVAIPDKWGYVDKTARLVIRPQFNFVNQFSEGYAAVQGGKWNDSGEGFRSWSPGGWGYINVSGKNVIPCDFEDAEMFSGGFAAIKKGGKWGFIDNKARVFVQPKYLGTRRFSEGLAPVLVPASEL